MGRLVGGRGCQWIEIAAQRKMEMKATMPSVLTASAGSAVLPASAKGASQLKPMPTSTSQSAAGPGSSEVTPQQLRQSVEELQRKVQLTVPSLQFSIDHDTGKTVIKVTDVNTNEVIRQIPAEEILRLAKEIDRMQGLLLHKQG